jgi:hypothetical protein
MQKPQKPPKNISELIDHLEQIREELLNIQRSMEKLEAQSTLPNKNRNKK